MLNVTIERRWSPHRSLHVYLSVYEAVVKFCAWDGLRSKRAQAGPGTAGPAAPHEDRDVVTMALRSSGFALKFTSEELGVVARAIKSHWRPHMSVHHPSCELACSLAIDRVKQLKLVAQARRFHRHPTIRMEAGAGMESSAAGVSVGGIAASVPVKPGADVLAREEGAPPCAGRNANQGSLRIRARKGFVAISRPLD